MPHLLSKAFLFFLLLTLLTACTSNQGFRTRAHQETRSLTNIDDITAEIEFGQNVAARLLGAMPLYDDKKINQYLNYVGNALAANADRPELKFYFAVIDADFINAYSTPGGYVFVTKPALEIMKDESELAAVLAHEIAHVTRKHIVKELAIKGKDKSKISSVTRLVGGGQDSARVAFFQAVDKAITLLLERGFKHEDELEADQVAALLLAQTGYDPHALVRYLVRAQKTTNEAPTTKSATHPATDERINKVRQLITAEGLTEVKLPRGKERFTQNVKIKR